MFVKKLGVVATALLVVVAGASLAHADSFWSGAVDTNWDDLGNWDVDPSGGFAYVNTLTNYPVITTANTLVPNDLKIGASPGANGQVDIVSGAFSANYWTFVGDWDGTGVLNITGTGSYDPHAVNGNANLMVGLYESTGVLNVNTEGTLGVTDLRISPNAPAGSGTFNLDNGTVNVAYNFQVGSDYWGPNLVDAFFNMTGGSVSAGSEMWTGGSGTGTTMQTGGVVSSGAWFVVGRNDGSVGVYDLEGGTVNAATDSGFAVIGSFGGSTGDLNISNDAVFNTGDGDTVSNMLIGEGGTGAVNVIGSLASVNVNGDLKLSLYDDNNDSTGVGTLGFVADASGVTTVQVGGDVNLSSADSDFLSVDLSAYTGPYVDIQLIDGATRQGVFDGLSQGTLAATDGNANPYYIDYIGTQGDVWLTTTAVVPEPVSAALLAAAFSALALSRKR